MSASETEPVEQYARIMTNHGEIVELTNLIRLRGVGTDGKTSSLVTDAILHFDEGEVSVKVFDPMASVWAHVRGPFEGVRRPGKLVLGSISEFRSYLDRFGEHTAVELTERDGGAFLTFDDEERKSGGYAATDEQHIKSAQDVEDLPYEYDPSQGSPSEGVVPAAEAAGVYLDTWFRCDVADIQDILQDGDTTEVRKYPLTVEDGSVQVQVGDDDGWIETDFVADAGDGVASSVYGYGIDNVISNLSGEVTIFLDDEGPMWVRSEDQNGYEVDYMIAEDESN